MRQRDSRLRGLLRGLEQEHPPVGGPQVEHVGSLAVVGGSHGERVMDGHGVLHVLLRQVSFCTVLILSANKTAASYQQPIRFPHDEIKIINILSSGSGSGSERQNMKTVVSVEVVSGETQKQTLYVWQTAMLLGNVVQVFTFCR